MNDPPRPVVRSEFTTADPATAEDFLRRSYIDNTLDVTGPRDDFTLSHTTVAAPSFSINRLRSGVDLVFDAASAPQDPLTVIELVGGGLSYVDNRYTDAHAGTGDALLCPPDGLTRCLTERFDLRLVPMDRAAVADYAAAMTGIAPEDLVFEAITTTGPVATRRWSGTVTHLRDDVLLDDWAATQPIVLGQAFHSLAAALLSTFPNTALARATDPEAPSAPGEVPAATLRAVADHLHDHAGEPIGPSDIAELAGMPVREIVEGFRRRRGVHPARLLWTARLRGVRRDLVDADPHQAGGVAAIAARWGFTRPGRFRVAYRRLFDEQPEATLRR